MSCYNSTPPLSDADRVVLTGYLAEAKVAYHAIMMGQQVVRIRDQNGEMIDYSPAKATELAGYIANLEAQLGIASSRFRRPMRTIMGR